MGNFCCKVLPVPLKLVSYYAANLNFGALFNINVKSAKPNAFLLAFIKFGRYLVPTGQTPLCFHNTSILVHPRKGLHKPPSNNWWRCWVLPPGPSKLLHNFNAYAIFKQKNLKSQSESVDLLAILC